MKVNNIFFTLIFALSLVLSVTGLFLTLSHNKHDYLFGKKKDSDKTLLLNKRARSGPDVLTHHILKQVFRVPTPKSLDGDTKPPPTPIITQVQVEDQGSGSKYCDIIGGGPGHTFVTLRFVSHRHASLNYLVTLYGHTPNKKDNDDESDSDE